jgi:hypothetical protein
MFVFCVRVDQTLPATYIHWDFEKKGPLRLKPEDAPQD